MEDIINAIIISVITGIIAGFISSVLVTRLSRFENLRSEAQRLLRGLEYMQTDNGGVKITAGEPDVTKLTHIASDFYALGHKKAGAVVNELITNINKALINPQSYTEIEAADAHWQSTGRNLKPNMGAILKLSLQI